MAYAPAGPDLDRLPWLTDDRKANSKAPAPRQDPVPLLLWSMLAAVLIAGASFWIGMRAPVEPVVSSSAPAAPAATIRIPPAPPAAPEVSPAPMPQIAIAPAPEVQLPASPRAEPPVSKAPAKSRQKVASRQRATTPKTETKPPVMPRWPSMESAGAAGRMVRIGTFSSTRQAKRGWSRIAGVYPGFGTLPAVVAGSASTRNGRTYYRLQVGTTSQAHSAVLCQWMRQIGQSCVVVGLPQQGGA